MSGPLCETPILAGDGSEGEPVSPAVVAPTRRIGRPPGSRNIPKALKLAALQAKVAAENAEKPILKSGRKSVADYEAAGIGRDGEAIKPVQRVEVAVDAPVSLSPPKVVSAPLPPTPVRVDRDESFWFVMRSR